MTDPLVVNEEIELPQLDIANNYTMDCTIPYSTGEKEPLTPLLMADAIAFQETSPA
jgi:hypothetical protein